MGQQTLRPTFLELQALTRLQHRTFKDAVLIMDMISSRDPRVMEAMQEFQAHIDDGGTIKDYEGAKPSRPNGKRWGTDAKEGLVLQAMTGIFRKMNHKDAPKAKNFAQNLIGAIDEATIDVWAARLLQRLAGKKRIPIPAEGGVTGNVKVSGKPGGQFGFGQEVFRLAGDQLGMAPSRTPGAGLVYGERILGGTGVDNQGGR